MLLFGAFARWNRSFFNTETSGLSVWSLRWLLSDGQMGSIYSVVTLDKGMIHMLDRTAGDRWNFITLPRVVHDLNWGIVYFWNFLFDIFRQHLTLHTWNDGEWTVDKDTDWELTNLPLYLVMCWLDSYEPEQVLCPSGSQIKNWGFCHTVFYDDSGFVKLYIVSQREPSPVRCSIND